MYACGVHIHTHLHVHINRADLFHAALCSLGCLGVITGAVIRAVPAFDLTVSTAPIELTTAIKEAHARARSAEYYRFWWFPYTKWCTEWRADKVSPHTMRAPPFRVPTLAAAASLWAWVRDSLFGFHLLQLALRIAVVFPALIPIINAVWFEVLFRGRGVTTADSVAQFNFDCLFKQHVDEWSLPLAALPRVRMLAVAASRLPTARDNDVVVEVYTSLCVVAAALSLPRTAFTRAMCDCRCSSSSRLP